jgi:hypothetical protein
LLYVADFSFWYVFLLDEYQIPSCSGFLFLSFNSKPHKYSETLAGIHILFSLVFFPARKQMIKNSHQYQIGTLPSVVELYLSLEIETAVKLH